jgi:glycosyltransferase involved in cell wall biosynthesis
MYDGLPDFDVTFITYSAEVDCRNIKDLLKDSQHVRVRNSTIFPSATSEFFLCMRSMLSKIMPVPPVNRLNRNDVEHALEKSDVVNCLEINSLDSQQCAELALNLRLPLVVTVYETRHHAYLNYIPPYSRNAKYVLRHANSHAITDRAKQYLLHLGVPDEKIDVIHVGIDTKKFAPSKKRNDGRRILFVGRLTAEKGLPYLVQAFMLLHRERPDTELWIVGGLSPEGGPTIPDRVDRLSYLREAGKKYPIRMLGSIHRTSMPEIYRQCDIFCLPSNDNIQFGMKIWDEQLGLALIEAMACGLPIVSTDCGAIPEVIGKGNLISKQRDVKDLYVNLKKMVDDDTLRDQLSQINRKRVETYFNIEIQKEKLNKFYKRICEDFSDI